MSTSLPLPAHALMTRLEHVRLDVLTVASPHDTMFIGTPWKALYFVAALLLLLLARNYPIVQYHALAGAGVLLFGILLAWHTENTRTNNYERARHYIAQVETDGGLLWHFAPYLPAERHWSSVDEVLKWSSEFGEGEVGNIVRLEFYRDAVAYVQTQAEAFIRERERDDLRRAALA